MSTSEVYYYDFLLGNALCQAPSAWDAIRVKLAAKSYSEALDIFRQLGFVGEVARIERYFVKSRSGATVVQYKLDGAKDVLSGVVR